MPANPRRIFTRNLRSMTGRTCRSRHANSSAMRASIGLGAVLGAMLVAAGCAGRGEPAASSDSMSSGSDATTSPAFAIGASEWSRGGRRGSDAGGVSSNVEPRPVVVSDVEVEPAEPAEPAEVFESSEASPSPAIGAVVVVEATSEAEPASDDRSDAAGTEIRARSTASSPSESPEVASPPEASPAAAAILVAPRPDNAEDDRPASGEAVAAAPTPPLVGTRETATGASRPVGPERPLSADPIEAAASILVAGVRSPDPVVRANALEGMLAWPSLLREHVGGGLVDDNRGVRFVAAMCMGRARLSDLVHLVQPLLRDPSESVQAAAIYALRRCGRPVDPSPLAAMVRSDDPEVRSNAYIVLGELGDSSSVAMVRDSLGRGMRRVHPIRVRVVELQAAETLVKLGSDDELEVVRAALFAPVEQGELSILACQILARLDDRSASPMLERLVLASGSSARPPEIRMAATQALAELGSGSRIDAASIAVDAMRSPSPLLRAQGCAVAGAAGGAVAIEGLRARLSDPLEFVRITAAGNLLKATGESSSVADATEMR